MGPVMNIVLAVVVLAIVLIRAPTCRRTSISCRSSAAIEKGSPAEQPGSAWRSATDPVGGREAVETWEDFDMAWHAGEARGARSRCSSSAPGSR